MVSLESSLNLKPADCTLEFLSALLTMLGIVPCWAFHVRGQLFHSATSSGRLRKARGIAQSRRALCAATALHSLSLNLPVWKLVPKCQPSDIPYHLQNIPLVSGIIDSRDSERNDAVVGHSGGGGK